VKEEGKIPPAEILKLKSKPFHLQACADKYLTQQDRTAGAT
jgi:hypothetical protein